MRLIVLGVLFASLASAQTQITGAQLRGLKIDQEHGTWEAELVNTGSRAITAYFVGIYVTGPDGRTGMGGGASADYLMSFVPPEERKRMRAPGFPVGPIEPGESQPLMRGNFGARGANGQPLPFEVRLGAVIYDDGTMEGDAGAAERIFSQRRAALKVQEKYIPKLLVLRGTPDPSEALRLLYREVTDELYDLDKNPEQPMNQEFSQAKGQLSMMQQEIRNLLQIAKNQQFFDRTLERLEQRLERVRSGVK